MIRFDSILPAIRLAIFCLAVFTTIAFQTSRSSAQPPDGKFDADKFEPAQIEFFEKKVRPLLNQHCLECHGNDPEKLRGGLWLTTREKMLEGGDSGAALVPGKPGESLLMGAVRYEDFEMPPSGQLKPAEIDVLEKWIAMGAPDPRRDAAQHGPKIKTIEQGRAFWSFRPRFAQTPPQVRDTRWPKSPIDQFILARLESKNVRPVPTADRETLVRRAYLTLIGLPPTVAQIDAFLLDESDTGVAFTRLVDQLLESAHFGERWGRHWLDVVRFAESSGGGRSLMFTDAWRFRDYVIDAYNRDLPFDQFVREQIAGDLLPFDSHAQRSRQIVATGMLALGPTNYEQQDKDLLELDVIDEQIDTVGRAFLGLTLGCARCHDHKFDPVPTADYYALAGIFKSTQSLVHSNVSKYVEQSLATDDEVAAADQFKKRVAKLSAKLADAKKQVVRLGGKPGTNGAIAKSRSAAEFPGIVIDNAAADLAGNWMSSTHTAHFVDSEYLHDRDAGKGNNSAVFRPRIDSGGIYEVRLSYSAGGNRASNVPVRIDHQDGQEIVYVNQSQSPLIDGLFISLGNFRFEADNVASVTVTNTDTDGHVVVDAIQFIPLDQDRSSAGQAAAKATDKPPAAAPALSEPSRNASADFTSPTDKKLVQARQLVQNLDLELQRLKKNAPQPSAVAMSVQDREQPVDSPVHIRGNVRNLGEVVSRGFVSVCNSPESENQIPAQHSGRLELAQWIASAEHPLTARVYVNRVWRHMFGIGLVSTPDNFGEMGTRPSHPELLDYLANEFVADGWSTKKLIRRIMLSHVYQLSTQFEANASSVDDQNRLLWRANRRRLDAEVLRDSMLAISGQLDLTPGGLTIRKIAEYDMGYEFDTVRRSVYVPVFRNSMLELFEVFDFANPNLVVGHRNTSTLPTQALYLMNSPVVIEQSQHAADLLMSENGLDHGGRIRLAYRRILGREPSDSELATSLKFISEFDGNSAGTKSPGQAWPSLIHALFASIDFRYLN